MKIKEQCEKIVEHLLKEGYRHQVSIKDLNKTIMEVREIIDERAISRWRRALITFGYIEHLHHGIFKINILKVPHIIALLKEKPQTKLS